MALELFTYLNCGVVAHVPVHTTSPAPSILQTPVFELRSHIFVKESWLWPRSYAFARAMAEGCVEPVEECLFSQFLVWILYWDPVGLVLQELALPYGAVH